MCSVEGCSRPRRTKGMCNACYEYLRKHGTVVRPPQRQPLPPEKRIWKFVEKKGPLPTNKPELGYCWVWKGAKHGKGYGHFNWSSRQKTMAHRAMWRILVGEIPESLQLDHLCLNTFCVNPVHLEPVTNTENMARAVTNRKFCRNDHDLTIEGTVMVGKRRMCVRCNRERFARFYAKNGGKTAYEKQRVSM